MVPPAVYIFAIVSVWIYWSLIHTLKHVSEHDGNHPDFSTAGYIIHLPGLFTLYGIYIGHWLVKKQRDIADWGFKD